MSRYCGENESGPILVAASHWKGVGLLDEGSIFSDKRLWASEVLDELDRYFVQNLDESDRGFLEKLKDQLMATSPAAKQLAAEMMWLLYLCPSSLTVRHKRQIPQTIWLWSGESLPENSPWLAEDVLGGIGSAGPGFNQNQWRELTFLINLVRTFKRLTKEERVQLVSDGWKFAEWLKLIPDWESRQFRHMILFLLFPDDFERIFGQRDRKAVVRVFSGLERSMVNGMDAVALDLQLRNIRKKLETEYGTQELDYYMPPLRERWKKADLSETLATITVEHVRLALAEIDREGTPASAQSTGYDLIEAGNRYPPKLVLSIAAKFATGQELDRTLFKGGIESQAFKVLEGLGFEISTKDLISPLIAKFLEQAQAANSLTVRGYLDEYRGLKVRVSFGQGNFARIPWIAFLGKGQAVPNGIYPVFLFFREQSVLLLCYGLSETNEPEQSWETAPGKARTVSNWFADKYGHAPDRYGQSFVKSAYDVNALPSMEILKGDLDFLIDQYEEILGESSEMEGNDEALSNRPDLGEASRSFSTALRGAFVDFGKSHERLVASFLASLVTKPLVILTGLSGSGKTQIALRLGDWLGAGRLHVAAVRPDWTGAEALFGYEDGLKPAVDGRGAWFVTEPLEFMLKAAAESSYPHLLVLDEMNLAHVERYFADVLSGMESGQPCLPNLVKGADGAWRVRAQGPDRIPFPRNLWIVGTVNVDETTYMFSPKVLDRANTFEFRVNGQDLQASSQKPKQCALGDPELIRGILTISRDDAWQQSHPASFRDELADNLRQLHTGLARYGMEFGHRVFYESLRFAALAQAAGFTTSEEVLDCIVMQKVLPRLHGSRKRLEKPLLVLAQFCRDLPESLAKEDALFSLDLEKLSTDSVKLPVSYDKLCRMLRNLLANQFTSFAE